MLFNSYIFVFVFLPVVLAGYFLLAKLNDKAAQLFLIGMSLWFYGYFNPWYLFIICGSVVFNYLFSKLLMKRKSRPVLTVGVLANIAVIFYYKYFNFFKENINALFGTDFVLTNIVLPLGISFFTFQQISFLVDSFRGETKDYGFIEYALFVVYFPQLIAGPIVMHSELIPQFRDKSKKSINTDNLYSGAVMFGLGLSKKVLLADVFARSVTWAWGNVAELTAMDVFIAMLSYAFQLYFDFSAYSDMATGIGRMFNIVIPMNFNSPYKALSFPELWDRWHLTLTRFLRQYVFFPLGGSRKGKVRTYINTFIVFLVSGIWHGANWTFILWGVVQGTVFLLTRLMDKWYKKLHVAFQWFLTFFGFCLTLILFRSDSVSQCLTLMARMFRMENMSLSSQIIESYNLPEMDFVKDMLHIGGLIEKLPAFWVAFFLILGFCICLNHRNNYEREFTPKLSTTVCTAFLVCYSIISLGGVSVFIYFNF
ncbi:MAG: MBOAT family protein [Butyrivibrio sp.]|nr:MBOAT family protein [Butyrivibrio sp.]